MQTRGCQQSSHTLRPVRLQNERSPISLQTQNEPLDEAYCRKRFIRNKSCNTNRLKQPVRGIHTKPLERGAGRDQVSLPEIVAEMGDAKALQACTESID